MGRAVFAKRLALTGAMHRKLADLVLLDADPLADIRNTRRISAVFANGWLIDARAGRAPCRDPLSVLAS